MTRMFLVPLSDYIACNATLVLNVFVQLLLEKENFSTFFLSTNFTNIPNKTRRKLVWILKKVSILKNIFLLLFFTIEIFIECFDYFKFQNFPI